MYQNILKVKVQVVQESYGDLTPPPRPTNGSIGSIFYVSGITQPGFYPMIFQSQGGHSTTRPLTCFSF